MLFVVVVVVVVFVVVVGLRFKLLRLEWIASWLGQFAHGARIQQGNLRMSRIWARSFMSTRVFSKVASILMF